MWLIALLLVSTSLLPAALADQAVTPMDPGRPSGNGVEPVWLPGIPTCADLAPEGQAWREVVADPATGTYGDGLLDVAIGLQQAMGGEVLDWEANLSLSAALVRSGSDTNFYAYDLVAAVTSDTLLHAPVELDGLSFLPVESVSFCYQAPPEDPGPPSGNGIQPVWMPGSPTCSSLAPAGTTWQELRVDPVADGTYESGDLRVSIDRLDPFGGQAFDWMANTGVDAIIVHDGSSSLYTYNPPAASTADTSLHATVDPGTYLFYPLASVSFCYQVQPPDPGPATERGIQPVWRPGSPVCAELAPTGVTWREIAVQHPVTSGSYQDDLLSVNLVRRDLLPGQVLDWTSNLGIDAVLVRGGGDTNLYAYQPPAAFRADGGLHAPVDATLLFHPLAEIAFCYQVPPQDPGPPSVGGVQPVWRDNGPSCADVAPTGKEWHQVTVEPVANGVFGDGYLNVEVDRDSPLGGETLGWSSNVDISAVLVHGGGNSNLYTYLPTPRWQDSRLHGPIDPSTYLFYNMERVAFCYEQGPEDPGPPSSNGTQPVWKLGDRTCADLAPAGATWRELKVGPVATGTFGDGLLALTLEHRRDMGGQSVSWSANLGIDAVFVKGELNGNLYQYEPPAEVVADTFLHAPVDPNLVLQEISYLSFCYDVAPSVAVELSGNTLSKVGDEVTYDLHIANDGDLPLGLVRVADSLLGDLTDRARAAGCQSLAPGTSCDFQTSRKVQSGDADPLSSSVTVTYSPGEPGGAVETVEAWDEHTVNLFQPAIAAHIVGSELAQAGDPVDYTVTLSNGSSDDTPPMVCTALSTLSGSVFGGVLPLGDTVLHLQRTVQPADPDPLLNTVTLNCSPEGFPNTYETSAVWSTRLYEPAISLTKTGEGLAHVGQQVTYRIVLNNESSLDTPRMDCILTDSAIGFEKQVALHSSEQDVSLVPYTVSEAVPDPFVNTVTATCLPQGAGNPIAATASWSTELFQARIAFSKTGDALSKRGDSIDYQIVLENRSSADAPDLECTLVDPMLDLLRTVTLAPGASYPVAAVYQVPCDAEDPLVNFAAVTCKTIGFSQTLVGQASHSTRLFEPLVALEKTGSPRSHVGGSVDYTIALHNHSSADTPDLACTISDPLLGLSEPVTLAAGESHEVSVTGYVVPANAPDPFVNTAVATCSPVGFPNTFRAEASWSVDLFQPAIELEKTGDALSQPGGSVDYAISLRNTSSADTPDLACTISDPTLQVEEQVTLAPGEVHTLSVLDHIVPLGAQGAYTNTATARCTPAGLSSAIEDRAMWVTELYQPALLVSKGGPSYARVGEKVTYSFYIRNTSSPNTPPLDLVGIVDDKLGDLTQLAREADCAMLEPGEGTGGHCQFTVQYTVQPGDDRGRDPDSWPTLVNTVVARYLPRGSFLEVTGSDTHSITLLHPGLSLAEACVTDPVPKEGPAQFAVLIENAGDVIPQVEATDGIRPFVLGAGGSATYLVAFAGPFGDSTVAKEVHASWPLGPPFEPAVPQTLAAPAGCTIGGRVAVLKRTNGRADPAQQWACHLYAGPAGSSGSPLAADWAAGDPDGVTDSDGYLLCPRCAPARRPGQPRGWVGLVRDSERRRGRRTAPPDRTPL